MEFTDSSLYPEVNSIISSNENPVHFRYVAVFIIKPKEEVAKQGQEAQVQDQITNQFQALHVINVDRLCDFNNNYTDQIMLEVLIGLGDLSKKIYPNQNNIQVALFTYPLNELGDIANVTQPVRSDLYNATLLDQGNPQVQQNSTNPLSAEDMNLIDATAVKFQLTEVMMETLRTIEIGGNFRNTSVKNVLTAVLLEESKKGKLKDGKPIAGVNVVEPDNSSKYDSIIFRQGTPLIKMGDVLQEEYGIYSSGLGFYYFNSYWWLWPLLNVNRYDEADKLVTIILVPSRRFFNLERTYKEHGDTLTILSFDDVHYRESSEAAQLNSGTGVRFADSRKMMDEMVEMKDNKAVVSRGKNNTEINAVQRPGDKNYAPVSDTPIRANQFAEYSKLASRDGNIISLKWENSNPELVLPGMAVKILFQGETGIETLKGILQAVHHYTRMAEPGITNTRHITSSTMSFYVKRITDE